MHFKLAVKFEIEWIMIMKFNIAIFFFTEKKSSDNAGPPYMCTDFEAK